MMGLAVFFMFLEGSTLGALSYMMQPMFDDAFVAGNSTTLYWVGAMLITIFVVRAISSISQKLLLTTIA